MGRNSSGKVVGISIIQKKRKEKKSFILKLQQFMGVGTGESLELIGQPAQTDN